MTDALPRYLTTRELADLIRVKERKVYDLAAMGEVPHSRATGKLLFPRDAVLAWIEKTGDSGSSQTELPAVVLGSHDPLLEWALRESGCNLASLFDGSLDGLKRFANREGLAAGIHIPDTEATGWNLERIEQDFAYKPVVLISWATRRRGLILPVGNPYDIRSVADLPGRRLVRRQEAAGTHLLMIQMMAKANLSPEQVLQGPHARDEREAAQAVFAGEADTAFGLESAARQSRLEFQPLCEERFDLIVNRRDYFEPAFQKLLSFATTPVFKEKAEQLGGYDITDLGHVRFNGA